MVKVSILARRKLVKAGFKDPGSGGSTVQTKQSRAKASATRNRRASSRDTRWGGTGVAPTPSTKPADVMTGQSIAPDFQQQAGAAVAGAAPSGGAPSGGWQNFTSKNKAWLEAKLPGVAKFFEGAKGLSNIPGAAGVMGMALTPTQIAQTARYAKNYNYASLIRMGIKTKDIFAKQLYARANYGAAFQQSKYVPGVVQKTAGVARAVQVNSKTMGLAMATVVKKTGRDNWSKLGHAVLWAAGAALLGLWGQAEAPESIAIPIGKLASIASTPEEFQMLEEAEAEMNDIISLPLWQAPFLGVPNKIKGMITGAKVLSAYVAGQKRKMEEGQDDETFWTNYQADKVADELMLQESFNTSRIETEQEILRLRKEARDQSSKERSQELANTIAAWEDYAARKRKMEADAMAEQAKFWLDYRKMIMKMQDEQGRSRLNFGIV